MSDNALLPELTRLCDDALAALAPVHHAAETAMRESVTVDGKIDASALDENQYAAHGFAWFSTYVTALKQMKAWADRLETKGKFGTLEQLILQAAFGEYLAQIQGGIAMSQGEFIRLSTLGVPADVIAAFGNSRAVATLSGSGNSDATRRAIADQIKDSLDTGRFGETGLEDETLDMVRDQFRRFVDEKVSPHAHGWHERDELIPIEIINEMSELGVFGLTIPEEFGGLGMGKTAMCVVTEELSRGYIGVGSLGTRSEIAAELIRLGG
ncbi:MAG: acyl-CoA dehydrogenase family protein, partial [Thalassospira sp.]|nr:acyl-CoA dehydrogenase family protein [Thalassospira sp.]